MHYQTPAEAFVAGIKALLPLTPGVIPFGLVTGVMAIEMGLSPGTAIGMTLLFYSGSAQMAALQLLHNGVFPLAILFTALIINLRFLMYSASLAPHLHKLPRRWTWPLSYIMSDQSYALCILKFSSGELGRFAHYYYAGSAVSMWLAWMLSVVAGVYLGGGIPESWSLAFAVPLSFLALLVPAIRNSPSLVAALIGGVVAVLGVGLPFNLGLLLASICGIAAGLMTEQLSQRNQPAQSTSGDQGEQP